MVAPIIFLMLGWIGPRSVLEDLARADRLGGDDYDRRLSGFEPLLPDVGRFT